MSRCLQPVDTIIKNSCLLTICSSRCYWTELPNLLRRAVVPVSISGRGNSFILVLFLVLFESLMLPCSYRLILSKGQPVFHGSIVTIHGMRKGITEAGMFWQRCCNQHETEIATALLIINAGSRGAWCKHLFGRLSFVGVPGACMLAGHTVRHQPHNFCQPTYQSVNGPKCSASFMRSSLPGKNRTTMVINGGCRGMAKFVPSGSFCLL